MGEAPDDGPFLGLRTQSDRKRSAKRLAGASDAFDVLGEQLQELRLVPEPDHAGDLLAVLEQEQGRNVHHAELARDRRELVNVELGYFQPSGGFTGNLLDDRG